jgi:transaldolase
VKLFLDAADSRDIRDAVARSAAGALTGANPDLVRELCGLVAGPVCAAVAPGPADEMLRRARELAGIAPHVVVALPHSPEGLEVARACAAAGIPVAVTGCAGPIDALQAARAGARYVAVTPARGGVAVADAMDGVRQAVASLRTFGFSTEVMAAPVTYPGEAIDAALAGAHVAVAPPALLRALAAPQPSADAGRAEPADAAPRVEP